MPAPAAPAPPEPLPEPEPLIPPAPPPAGVPLRTVDNQPPAIDAVLPAALNRTEVVVRLGKPLKMTFVVRDPEGAPVHVQILGMPAGAAFDAATRTFSWTPSPEQRGDHVLRLVVSDGVREASRTFSVQVVDNRAPRIEAAGHVTVVAGQPSSIPLRAHDPDGDDVTIEVSGLPPEASYDARSAHVAWTPPVDEVGRSYVLEVTASDGELFTTRTLRAEVLDPEPEAVARWHSFLLPGGGYSVYRPRDEELGTFRGVTLELLAVAWIHRTENRGPSHGRIYANVELTRSSRGESPILFAYNFGSSLSFERNPVRSWLIPHYGLDLGGIVHDELGSRFQTTPYVGLHLYTSPNLFANLRGGYRLVPSELDRLGGWHVALTGDFSVW